MTARDVDAWRRTGGIGELSQVATGGVTDRVGRTGSIDSGSAGIHRGGGGNRLSDDHACQDQRPAKGGQTGYPPPCAHATSPFPQTPFPSLNPKS